MINCYPTPDKAKARVVCEAFAQGAGGTVCDPRKGFQGGASFFYGVVDATRAVFEQARKGEWLYADNSYFDRGRQGYFRVTRNAFQLSSVVPGDYKRLARSGVTFRPWRASGTHVLVCEQSADFMQLCGFGDGWTRAALAELHRHTDRPLRVRAWSRDKGKMMATLKADLVDAWAVVTHMSATANEALLAGIPVFVTGDCAALPMAGGQFTDIENPRLPDNREEWAAGLVTNQWTLDEMKSGKCWGDLNGQ